MTSTGQSTPLVAVMLFGWIPIVLALFALLPSRRAVIVAFVAGWLFLPVAGYRIQFFPEYTKMSATCMGIFCATLIFDSERFFKFRPNWYDIPAAMLCLVPFFSSVTNGLGPYDGMSAVLSTVITWGMPYFLGRIYFNEPKALRELVIGIFIGGLLYVPLCLLEIRISPQLHRLVYGFHPHSFVQTFRYGGWRPVVFLAHGLMVGMWMAAASLCGFWLWRTKSLKQIFGVPMWLLVLACVGTTVLCKSTGAIVLMFLGMGILALGKKWRSSVPIVTIAALIFCFVMIRALGIYDGWSFVDVTDQLFGSARSGSVETRIMNENLLSAHARDRILFGWGGWGRSRIVNEEGKSTGVTDSLWIVKFGANGLVGLLALLGVLLLPCLVLGTRIPPPFWAHPIVGQSYVAAMIVTLWMVDNVFNAMLNPIFVVVAGGVVGLKRVRIGVRSAAQPRAGSRRQGSDQMAPAERIARRRLAAKRPQRP